MKEQQTWLVYALACPILNAVFYIGRTTNLEQRLYQHKTTSNQPIHDWIVELRAISHQPIVFVLQRIQTTDEAILAERYWIGHYSRISPFLLNSYMAGPPDSVSTRRKKTDAEFASYLKRRQRVAVISQG